MSKKSKKTRNGNHNHNTPQPVRIQPEHQFQTESNPEHQAQTEANPELARGWFPRIRAFLNARKAEARKGWTEGWERTRAAYEAAKAEAADSVILVRASAGPRVACGRRMVQVDPKSPNLRVAGAALVVATVWGPLGWTALGIGIVLLVRPALLPRLAADGLAWAMAGAVEADRLLVRAWAAVSTKCKIAAASLMVTSALFWAKVRARMAAPVVEAEPAC